MPDTLCAMEAILETQNKLQMLFEKKMDAFQSKLQESSAPATTVDEASLVDEFAEFRTFMLTALKSLQEQINLLARESDAHEMRSRRKILLIHGVPESEGRETAVCVVDVVTKQLKVSDFQAQHISRCHRMGRPSVADRPRPILLKLHHVDMKQKLWSAKTALKGTGITLSEFLTKPRHDAFMAARQRFGINKCWTKDGFIFVLGSDGKRHRLSCIEELDKIELPAQVSAAASAASKTVLPKSKATKVTKPKETKRKPTPSK